MSLSAAGSQRPCMRSRLSCSFVSTGVRRVKRNSNYSYSSHIGVIGGMHGSMGRGRIWCRASSDDETTSGVEKPASTDGLENAASSTAVETPTSVGTDNSAKTSPTIYEVRDPTTLSAGPIVFVVMFGVLAASLVLANESTENARAAISFLRPIFLLYTLLFLSRIVMTWYPALDVKSLPLSLLYAPTEPVLRPTRAFFTPVGGVDISPIVWLSFVSFANEILLGPQGLLVLLSNKQSL